MREIWDNVFNISIVRAQAQLQTKAKKVQKN